MKKSIIGRGLIFLLLVSFCAFGFKSAGKAEAPKSAKILFTDPEDMVQGGYYYFWDHGSGASVAQYDRMENDNIYTTYSITPAQLLFSQNKVFTLYEAGNIDPANLLQIAHLLRCILAGVYVL